MVLCEKFKFFLLHPLLYLLGSSLPDQLVSLQSISPGATSPTASALPLQSTHGIDQLAQVSVQSARLATQVPTSHPMNFVDSNEVKIDHNIGYQVGLNSAGASTLMNAVHGLNAACVKQEQDNVSSNPSR